MNSRAKSTWIVAGVLVALIMGAALLLTFTGGSTAARFSAQETWSQNMPNMQSMKIIDLTGDGQNDLFLQNESSFRIVDANGRELQAQNFGTPLATTMGDVNGDGVEDVAVFAPGSAPSGGGQAVVVFSQNERLWSSPIEQASKSSAGRGGSFSRAHAGDCRRRQGAVDCAGQGRPGSVAR